MRHVFPTLAVTTALIALPAFGGGQFKDMDADADGSVSMTEFDTGMQDAGWFMEWNTNGDDTLSREEFETGLYGLCDADADGQLSNTEFDSCISAWMGDQATAVSFADLDADTSDSLSQEEFAAGIGEAKLFEEIAGTSAAAGATTTSGATGTTAGTDTSGAATSGATGGATMAGADEGITEEAFKQGLFERFDANSDGMLSQEELPELSGTTQQ